jgi:hypothetical protein
MLNSVNKWTKEVEQEPVVILSVLVGDLLQYAEAVLDAACWRCDQ